MLSCAALPARAQETSPTAGCVLQKDVYSCDGRTFVQTLRRAQTIAVEALPQDRFTSTQLRACVEHLGKTVAPAGSSQTPDLTLLLAPVEGPGVVVGPADHPLATLRVYATGPDGGRGSLVWAETLRGQGDRPWPSQVHALIEQFEARFPPRSAAR